jgi:hypothetical protein
VRKRRFFTPLVVFHIFSLPHDEKRQKIARIFDFTIVNAEILQLFNPKEMIAESFSSMIDENKKRNV